jgi:hypothetical protein
VQSTADSDHSDVSGMTPVNYIYDAIAALAEPDFDMSRGQQGQLEKNSSDHIRPTAVPRMHFNPPHLPIVAY